MGYLLQDYIFYDGEIKLFNLKRIDYIIYSILKVEDSDGNLLIKCRILPLTGFSYLKILKKKLRGDMSFIKKNRLYYLRLTLDNDLFEITILPKSDFSFRFKGDFIINDKKVGVFFSKTEGFCTKRFFEFTIENNELIHYCLIYFALRHYDIDDVP